MAPTPSFADLIGRADVSERMELDGSCGVMAIHGGIERHTDTIAHAVADRCGASRYVVTQPASLGWHVPSTRHEPGSSAALDEFLDSIETVVSIHGFGRPHLGRSVLVGGRNAEGRERMAEALRRGTELRIVTGDHIPRGLRGLHPANPVNRPAAAGVQLELSHWPRRPPHVSGLIDAIAQVVAALSRPSVA